MSTTKTYRTQSGLYNYLSQQPGLLERGDELAIKKAKREYRKLYQRLHKQQQRAIRAELVVPLSIAEERIIAKEAKRHGCSRSHFLYIASIAYLTKTFVVPIPEHIAAIEQTLSAIRNEVQELVRKSPVSEKWRYQDMEERLTRIEQLVADFIHSPSLLEEWLPLVLSEKPELKAILQKILREGASDS